MSSESTVNKFKKTKYTLLGQFIGVGIALLLSAVGLDMPMPVGYVLGLCIGLALDLRKQ